MNIKTLLSGIQKTSHTFDVTGLSLNTQSLQKGDIFVAIQGTQKHGSEFVQNAIDKGCIAILVEDRDFQCSVPSIGLIILALIYQIWLKPFIKKHKTSS